MRAFFGVVLLLVLATAAGAGPENASPPKLALPLAGIELPGIINRASDIIPGVQLGPVKLGMSAYDAAGVALAFEHATGCQIDLLIVAGHVVAAGTRFGGCLNLTFSKSTARTASATELRPIPWDPVIGMPASAFIAALGDPLQINLMADRLALIWPQGLVAHVGGIHGGDGNVTYLAVVMPGTAEVPAIGYLRISLTSGFREF